MAPRDDASSDGDASDADYIETNVLLGYASKEPTDDNFSQLGGQPTWPTPTSSPPSFTLTRCPTCQSPMPLLLQLNGDAPTHFPGHTRRLYIFGCRRRACARKASGSVRVLRAASVDAALAAAERAKNEAERAKAAAREAEEAARRKAQGALGTAVFGSGSGSGSGAGTNPFAAPANPFAAGGGGAGVPANPFAAKPAQQQQQQPAGENDSALAATFAEKARIAASAPTTSDQPTSAATPVAATPPPYEAWPSEAAALAKPYPAYHLDADYETLAPEDDKDQSLPANATLEPEDGDDNGGGGSGKAAGAGSKEEKQIYESLMDRTFQKFADRLAQNPEQVLRYEWRGRPLLYSRRDAVGQLLDDGEEGDEHDDEDDEDNDEGKNAKVKTTRGKGKGMPRCANCGAERVFEVQLTPQTIAELEAEELGLEGMEWGTIIVGVCSKDCMAKGIKDGEIGYVEEWAGVQWEEIAERK